MLHAGTILWDWDHADYFAARLASSFVYGIQFGWWDIDMKEAAGHQFLDPKHQPEIEYLRKLS